MNILFITGRYGKNAAANGICIKNLIDELSNSNNIFCLCYEDFVQKDDKNCKIIAVKKGFLHYLQYKYKKNKKNLSIVNNLIKIKNLFFLPTWPWTDPIYTIKAYKKCKKICFEKNIDIIVAAHMPLSSLIIASYIKKKKPNIKYVAYFLDSLSGGRPLSIMPLKWNLKKKLKWERKLLENADKIIFMEASRKHQEKYNKDMDFYKKVTYLDIPLLKEPQVKCKNNYFDNDKINISFCGTANYPLRNLPFLLNVIKQIDNKNIVFHFFGNSNYEGLFNCKLENVKYHSFVSHEEIDNILNSSDFLLNLGTTTLSTISGKIFEYMSYGKPIISTYSIEEESCIPYLIKYKNSVLINENNENISEEAKKIEEFIKENIEKKIEYKDVKRDFYKNTPEAFAKEILK